MFVVRFINPAGDVDHDDKFNSLRAAMNAINRWFMLNNGHGEARVAYKG